MSLALAMTPEGGIALTFTLAALLTGLTALANNGSLYDNYTLVTARMPGGFRHQSGVRRDLGDAPDADQRAHGRFR